MKSGQSNVGNLSSTDPTPSPAIGEMAATLAELRTMTPDRLAEIARREAEVSQRERAVAAREEAVGVKERSLARVREQLGEI